MWKDNLIKDFEKNTFPPRLLLSKLKLIEEKNILHPANIPFYYYLGKHFPCKNLLQIGLDIGIYACCYLTSCQITENFLAIQIPSEEYYPLRMAISNVKLKYKNKFECKETQFESEWFQSKLTKSKWNLAIINCFEKYDKSMMLLRNVWDNLDDNGIILINNVNKDNINKIYKDFCIIKNRDNYIFKNKYGIGLVEKL